VTGHRLVALLEILSPANKDRKEHLQAFAEKVASALDLGVHVLVVDLFPPGPHDPQGIHGVIRHELDLSEDLYDLPSDEPFTLVSYAAETGVEVYLEHLAPGAILPDMPLFIRPDRYVDVPLESTYQAAYSGMPQFWRNVLEGKTGLQL
jgi:sugar phosphate isomerase/epimerase